MRLLARGGLCGLLVIGMAVLSTTASANVGSREKPLFAAQDAAGLWGYLDTENKWAIRPQFHAARQFERGVAIVMTKAESGKPQWGAVRRDGTVALPIRFMRVQPSDAGFRVMQIVDNQRKYGLHDFNGKQLLPAKYDYIDEFSDGLAVVREKRDGTDYYGYVDTAGRIIVPIKHGLAKKFSEGLATLKDKPADRSGSIVINTKGQIIFRKPTGFLATFSDGWTRAGWAEGTFYYDRTGKTMLAVPIERGRPDDFHDGLALIRKDRKAGYMNKKGQIVIPIQYDNAYPFKHGRARVKVGKSYGVIDTAGRQIMSIKHTSLSIRNDRMIEYTVNGRKALSTIDGKFVTFPTMRRIGDFEGDHAPHQNDNTLWGVMNRQGVQILPPVFVSLSEVRNGYVLAERRYGLDGRWQRVLPISYVPKKPAPAPRGLVFWLLQDEHRTGDPPMILARGGMTAEDLAEIDKVEPLTKAGKYKQAVAMLEGFRKKGWPAASTRLAWHYRFGKGVETNPQKAMLYLFESAKVDPIALYQLAMIAIRRETGRDGDMPRAFDQMVMVAQEGYGPALRHLAAFFVRGQVVVPDEKMAFQLANMGANKNDPWAILATGMMLIEGYGTDKNPDLGVTYVEAAGKTLPEASYRLGLYYEKSGNKALAIQHFKSASDRGHPDAKAGLKRVSP